MNRSRQIHAILIALTIPLGLASRIDSLGWPSLVDRFGGDVLSATCIAFGVRFVFSSRPLLWCAAFAYAICVLIELQQLVTWEPLLRLREDTAADILLGHGFLWSDLICYAVGVLFAALISRGAELRVARRSQTDIAPTPS